MRLDWHNQNAEPATVVNGRQIQVPSWSAGIMTAAKSSTGVPHASWFAQDVAAIHDDVIVLLHPSGNIR